MHVAPPPRPPSKNHLCPSAPLPRAARHLCAPHSFTFGRVASILRAGPLGRRLWWRLPTQAVPLWLLLALADVVNLERYRLT
jgi:hypothetical protein